MPGDTVVEKGASIHMHIYWLILSKLITISCSIMLIEKNIFISGLIISIGYEANIQGFLLGMGDKSLSFSPWKQYAIRDVGLAFWSKWTKLSFIEWPFMYNSVSSSSIPNETWDVVRYLNLVRVKTRMNYGKNSIDFSNLIRSQVRFLDPYYFYVTYSMYSVTKRYRYGYHKHFSEIKRFSPAIECSCSYWMFLEIEFSYGWILAFDHLGREIGALYVRHLYDNFVRKYRDYHSDNDIEIGGFVIRAKRTSSYITIQLLCGEILESYIRIKVSALLGLQRLQP